MPPSLCQQYHPACLFVCRLSLPLPTPPPLSLSLSLCCWGVKQPTNNKQLSSSLSLSSLLLLFNFLFFSFFFFSTSSFQLLLLRHGTERVTMVLLCRVRYRSHQPLKPQRSSDGVSLIVLLRLPFCCTFDAIVRCPAEPSLYTSGGGSSVRQTATMLPDGFPWDEKQILATLISDLHNMTYPGKEK